MILVNGKGVKSLRLPSLGTRPRLLDSANFSSYRNGRRHQCIGGLARKSPVRLEILRSGQWHVVVDMEGLGGTARSSVKVLQGALPPLR
jgi:hypothetical protein